MRIQRDAIVVALLVPEKLRELSMSEWDLLIRQGRAANLLARLANQLIEADYMKFVPKAPRLHLISALKVAKRQNVAVRREVECIRQALISSRVELVLLKGAAYVMANLVAGEGRTFSDIDILVPKSQLSVVEGELMIHGWKGAQHDAYDQRYYRRWMHEIPPMLHVLRGTTIDVHHAILPETARVKVNTMALFGAVVPLPGCGDLYTLRETDMFLHSATHLFHEGNFEKGLRDLFDLDSLLREFLAHDNFLRDLIPRATDLGLTRPLYYALRYTSMILETPIPAAIIDAAKAGRPSFLTLKLMDLCYLRALRPMHISTESFGKRCACFALYVRSHWIRMPLHLLFYHLGRKAFTHSKLFDAKKLNEQVI
jgi:hypothetical protein